MKWERLKSSKDILRLFSAGSSHLSHPILMKWELNPKSESPNILFTTAVSAKRIKRAVDRNLIKRRMREAVRIDLKNRPQLTEKLPSEELMVIYIFLGKEPADYREIEKSIKKLHNKLFREISRGG